MKTQFSFTFLIKMYIYQAFYLIAIVLWIMFWMDKSLKEVFQIQKESTRYYIVHLIFNSLIVRLTYKDAYLVVVDGVNEFITPIEGGGYYALLCIAAFHLGHLFLPNYTKHTTDDYLHHISTVILFVLSICLPVGKHAALVCFSLCGLPGGIDYFLLSIRDFGFITKIREKRINRYLHLIIRWPLIFLPFHNFLIYNHIETDSDKRFFLWTIAFPVFILICLNPIYYADRVIGNYYLTKM